MLHLLPSGTEIYGHVEKEVGVRCLVGPSLPKGRAGGPDLETERHLRARGAPGYYSLDRLAL